MISEITRIIFHQIRKFDERISVRPNAWKAHPERKFTALELIRLVQGKGRLLDNRYPTAHENSFLWVCREDDLRITEIALLFDRTEDGDLIVIIHAYREV